LQRSNMLSNGEGPGAMTASTELPTPAWTMPAPSAAECCSARLVSRRVSSGAATALSSTVLPFPGRGAEVWRGASAAVTPRDVVLPASLLADLLESWGVDCLPG